MAKPLKSAAKPRPDAAALRKMATADPSIPPAVMADGGSEVVNFRVSSSVVDQLDMEIYDVSSQQKTPDSGNWALGQPTDLKALQNYYRVVAEDPNAFPVADQAQ